MVFVKTRQGVGSGFYVTIGNENFVVSNAHVVENASSIVLTDIKGAVLKIKTVEFSDKSDMVRFRVEETSMNPLTIRKSMPVIGEKVYVCGNSSGANVITEICGKVLGVGPSEIEVDAKFVSGNSGSPVIDEKNEVLGVATYATREMATWVTASTRFSDVRRFALRMNVDDWISVTYEQVSEFLNLHDDIWKAIIDIVNLTLKDLESGTFVAKPEKTELFWKYKKEDARSKFIFNKTWGDKIALFCDDYFALLKDGEKIRQHSVRPNVNSFLYKDYKRKKASIDKNLLLVCDEAITIVSKQKGYTSFANNRNTEMVAMLNLVKSEIGLRKENWLRTVGGGLPGKRLDGWKEQGNCEYSVPGFY
jgi:hypothetical protein